MEELLNCYQALGKYTIAEKKIEEYIRENNAGNNDIILEFLYELKLENNEYEAASLVVDKRNELALINKTGMNYNKGIIQILEGNYSEARKTINKIGDSKSTYPNLSSLKYFYLFSGEFSKFIHRLKLEIRESHYIGWVNQYRAQLLYFYIGIGLNDEASDFLNSFDRGIDAAFPASTAIFLELEIQNEIALGNLEKSRKLLKDLIEMNKKVFSKKRVSRKYNHILGKFHDKNNQYELAETYYQKSLKGLELRLNSQYAAPFYYNTALFYYRHRQYDKAEPLLLHIHKLSNGRIYRGDLYAKSIYYLGKIYQKKGWTGKAIKLYQKFYKMWKDGDQEFVGELVQDTEKQLNQLKF